MTLRLAVLSDIHANIEAFRAVVRDLEGRADGILHLGDLVGYNASPNECIRLARELDIDGIAGNHDQAACEPSIAESFNIYARRAILWTRQELTDENMELLAGLQNSRNFSLGLACHGSPESANTYLALHFQARSTLKKLKSGLWGEGRLCLYGHTHKPKVWRMDIRGKVAPVEIPAGGPIHLNGEEFYLINPGSVGQPRSGDPRASYLILDASESTATFRLVEYDLKAAMKKIIKAKLPEFFAKRLQDGS